MSGRCVGEWWVRVVHESVRGVGWWTEERGIKQLGGLGLKGVAKIEDTGMNPASAGRAGRLVRRLLLLNSHALGGCSALSAACSATPGRQRGRCARCALAGQAAGHAVHSAGQHGAVQRSCCAGAGGAVERSRGCRRRVVGQGGKGRREELQAQLHEVHVARLHSKEAVGQQVTDREEAVGQQIRV